MLPFYFSKGVYMVTVSMAALKEREESLKETVLSLIDQVDKINIFLHGFTKVPEFLKHEKINYTFGMSKDSKEEIGDLGKFAFEVTEGYHLTCDDDLIYPSDYVERMTEAIDEYQKKCIVSFMGTIPYTPPIGSYYRDRLKYGLFENLVNDYEVDLPGTGVMGYHTDLIEYSKLNEYLEDQFANMADVHIGVFAKENNIPVVVRNHPSNWVKHSLKIDFKETIFEKHVNDDLSQTELINKNWGEKKVFDESMPKISIVVINTRQLTDSQYISECFNSLRDQIYQNIEIIVVKNYSKFVTIGKAWNDGVEEANGDYVLFVGDDDYLSPDYVLCLVNAINNNPEGIHFATNCTNFSYEDEEYKYQPKKIIPTGLWRKDYLVKNPACEYLTKFVDVEMISKLKKLEGMKQTILNWHYGYYYRSHKGQVSGQKLV